MNTYRDKSPDEIERDIVATREHIDRTLNVLSERLSPSGLLDQALHTARDTGGEFTLNLGRTVRDNPVPAALLGLGLGWLMVADRRRKAGGNGYGWTAEGHDDWEGDGGYDLAESDGGDGSYRRRVEAYSASSSTSSPDGARDGGDGSYRRRVESAASSSPMSSIEGRPADVPEDWSAAYEAQPNVAREGGRSGAGDGSRGVKDRARDAYSRGRQGAAGMRASWAERSRRGSERAHDTADRLRARGRDASDRIHDARGRFAERVEEGRRGMADSAGEAMAYTRAYGEAAGERASELYRRSGYAARSAGYRVRDAAGSAGAFAREHPLAVGLAVAAAGALIAALAPRSRHEDEWMGERSDEVKAAARDAAYAEMNRARDAASAALHTGSEELRNAGLTADDAKRAADEKAAAGIGAAAAAATAGADRLHSGERGSASSEGGTQSAEEALGADTADKIRPEPSAAKPERDAKPAGGGGVSGIETPSVAGGGGAGATVEKRPAEAGQRADIAAGQSGHDRS